MKAEKAEISRRIEEVLRIIVDGAEFHDIVQYASEKAWGVGERQLWNYVARANALLAERTERDRDKLFARHVSQRRNLYARALNAADYGTAGRVLRDEAELEGLYPAKGLTVTGKNGGPVVLHVTEEVVGHKPGTPLLVQEEVVTHGPDSSDAPTAGQEGPPAPGPASVPQE